ncbi:DUF551 domain-containing protein [Yersinia enterocolitica]|uniref:DUF551 domain-containing protein n=1 Tax=Yersinia enterocolitica TaxID=630 RepID=UPI001C678F0F|nr:DUF551 domain-containing protein [Yersinia enterocolitica]MBW5868607.1 DUF551 domain-containing protein [Yersinia enterocolitica]
MNKDLDSFTIERLEEMAVLDESLLTIPASHKQVAALARIALAAKRAEPVAYITYKGYLIHAGDPKLSSYSDQEQLYDAPQLDSPEMPDGWIKCIDQMPTDSSEFLVYETMNNKVQHDYWVSDDAAALGRGFWNHYDTAVTHWMPLPTAPEKPL